MSKLLENHVRQTRPVLGSFENDGLVVINGAARSPVSLAKASGKHFEPFSTNNAGQGYNTAIGMNGASYDSSHYHTRQQARCAMLTKPTWDSAFPSTDLMLPSGELLVGNVPAYNDGVSGTLVNGKSTDNYHYGYRANDLSIISEQGRTGNYFIGENATHYYTLQQEGNGHIYAFYKYDKTTGQQVHGSKVSRKAPCSWKVLHSDANSILFCYGYQSGLIYFYKYDMATDAATQIGSATTDSHGNFYGTGFSNLISTGTNTYRMFSVAAQGNIWYHDIDVVAGTVVSTNANQDFGGSQTYSQSGCCWIMPMDDGTYKLFHCQQGSTSTSYAYVGSLNIGADLQTFSSMQSTSFDTQTGGITGLVFFGDGARTPEKICFMGTESGTISAWQYDSATGNYTNINEILDYTSGVRSIMGDSKGRLWITHSTDYDVYIANHDLATTYSIHVQLPSDANILYYDAEDLARNIRCRVFDNLGNHVATDVTIEIYGHGTKFADGTTKKSVMTTVNGDGYVDVPIVISAPGAVQFSAYLTL